MKPRPASRRAALVAGALAAAVIPVGAASAVTGTNGKIAYVTNPTATPNSGEIFTINPDGSGIANLSNNPGSDDSDPSYSPDGSRIAFTSNRSTKNEIWVMNSDGSNAHQITNTVGNLRSNGHPTWSPDASQIAFGSNAGGSSFDVHVVNADGGNPHVIAGPPNASEFNPAWSPDGTLIAFESRPEFPPGTTPTPDYEIWVVRPDGLGLQQITSAGSNRFPTWSPDSSTITFTSTRDGNDEIYSMGRDGSNQHNLTNDPPRSERYPVWAPDGTVIAFRRGNQIWRMNPDGSNPVAITAKDIANRDIQPSWQGIRPGNGQGGVAGSTPPPGFVPSPGTPGAPRPGTPVVPINGVAFSITKLRALPSTFFSAAPGSCSKAQIKVKRSRCARAQAKVGTTLLFSASGKAKLRARVKRVGAKRAAGFFLVRAKAGKNNVHFVGLFKKGHPLAKGRYTISLASVAAPGKALASVKVKIVPAG